jgi:hypothetical protein
MHCVMAEFFSLPTCATNLKDRADMCSTRGPTRPHETYEISKSRDFEPDFLISNLISVDF